MGGELAQDCSQGAGRQETGRPRGLLISERPSLKNHGEEQLRKIPNTYLWPSQAHTFTQANATGKEKEAYLLDEPTGINSIPS